MRLNVNENPVFMPLLQLYRLIWVGIHLGESRVQAHWNARTGGQTAPCDAGEDMYYNACSL